MTEDKTDIRDRLLDAALPIVAFDGWSDATLKAAAAETGIDWPVARAVFPRGGIDMALAQHARGDAVMIAKLKEGTPPDMRYRDKVAHAVRLRIEAAGDREVVRRAIALFALPHLAPEGARAFWNTADAIWTALGDTSEDYNWYTKRATLSGVYSSTVLFWLGDDSAGHQATWDFLDRRIEDVMRFEKLKAGVEKNPLLKPVFAVPTWLLGRVRRPQRGPGGYPGWTGPRPQAPHPVELARQLTDCAAETGAWEEDRMMPETMRAVEISEPGGPEVLKLIERPMPEPGQGQVLLKVAYAGVNRPDALQRAGNYAPPPDASDLPGLEASGEVVAVGPGAEGVAVGDKVCALLPGGGYADYVVTPAAHCLPVPEGMGMKEAACLPETFFTVWSNVFTRGGLKGGERFLVHGGSSGIGTTAIQLGHAFGARVFATAGSADKCKACTDLGAERAINYRDEDFVEVLKAEGGADLILDMVGGDYIGRNIKALAEDGRLVQIAFLQGPVAELNFAQIMVKRLTVTGSTLRPQSVLAKARIARDLREAVWPLLSAGRIAPVMDSSFALADAAKAHARMESSEHIGKIVLEVSGQASSWARPRGGRGARSRGPAPA